MEAPALDPSPGVLASEPRLPKRYLLETWGCQMNMHDAERLAGMLHELGYERARNESEVDLFLLNTCAVRDKAVQKVLSRLGELRGLKKLKPRLVVAVAGCVAQQEQERLLTGSALVDVVVGPRALHSLPRLLDEVVEGRRRVIDVSQEDDRFDEPVTTAARDSVVRGYVTIMEGCDKNCSFCIVPYTRGREVYRPAAQVVEEARALVAGGALEVELLGQTVNAWKHDGRDFADLLGEVARVPGLKRLRFTTSHPRHLDDRVIEAMAGSQTVCPQLHLPVQSGSDRILKRMYRGHTRAFYVDRVEKLRARLPGIGLSTDIIVGFPGESDEDFRASMSLLDELRFDQVYSFTYSPRPHTRALAFADGVPESVMKERLVELQSRQVGVQAELYQAFVGRTIEVLVDGPSKTDPARLGGRSACGRAVNFAGSAENLRRIVDVEIVSASSFSLSGRVATRN